MKARDLQDAIALVNQTGYGLTSGLETLDDREQKDWLGNLRAGNLYINRVTTGAVVLRQPFGGMGKSVFGPGIKAGGPNYVAQLLDFKDNPPASMDEPVADPLLADLRERLRQSVPVDQGVSGEEAGRVIAAIGSFARSMAEEFGCEHDHFRLLGQDNIRRYLPVRSVRVRVHPADGFFEVVARLAAARNLGCHVTLSVTPGISVPGLAWLGEATEDWREAIAWVEEDDRTLVEVIRKAHTERLRYASAGRVPTEVLAVANEVGLFVARAPVLAEGRVELLWYLREQSVSRDYHRHGNLGERASWLLPPEDKEAVVLDVV